MLHKASRTLAGVLLTSMLILAVPAPSHAGGFRQPVQSIGWTARFWNWLESLVLKGTKATPTASLSEQEGSAIDPNGHS
jgi:hypothetical protein